MIRKIHTNHNEIEATIKLAKENLFWPGMNSQIREIVQNYEICCKFADSQRKAPMQSHRIPIYPFEYVSLDVCYGCIKQKKQTILVTVDHFSDFFEANILKDLTPKSVIEACKENFTPKSVIEACKENFSRHGIPKRICTDNGTNMVNEDMEKFAKEW
ncbi:Integrase zinc binding domain [Popillia japonica]|uniref:RNA-directed DNA polymerase n=1 Tax=Popillia japonica TaxID=7064 RepID=A0AAW1MVL4_POPJA